MSAGGEADQHAGALARLPDTAVRLDDAFVLSTHWDTFLSFDPATRRLTHALPEDALINLVVCAADGALRTYKMEGGQLVQSDCDEINAIRIQEVPSGPFAGKLSISVSGLYGTAEADGTVTINRSAVHGWEVFSRTPLLEALSRQTRTMLAKRRHLEITAFPKFPRGRTIPKIIHQTYMSDRLPARLAANASQLRRQNPDFEYRFWSNQDVHDFIYESYGYDVLTSYLRINPKYGACRADLFRYLCIYKFGGVYLDIKSNTTRKLTDIIRDDDEYIFSQWDIGHHPELMHIPGGEFANWHVIASKGHPFLEKVIDAVLRNIETYDPTKHGVGKLGVIRVSGPIAYTLAIHDFIGIHKHRLIDVTAEGLEYNAVGSYTREFFPHYSSLNEPIVT